MALADACVALTQTGAVDATRMALARAGLAGGLLAHHLTTIDPKQFIFLKTFDILLIVVLGGVGSITGSVVAAIVVTVAMEALRFLDGPLNLGLDEATVRGRVAEALAGAR